MARKAAAKDKKPARKAKVAKKPNLFTWLRSGLRSMSRRHAPIYEALAAAKRPYKGKPSDVSYNPRQKVAYCCALCGGDTFSSKEVAVDHRVDCGSLSCWEDVQGFMQRLFCDSGGLDVLCHTCHDAKTFAVRYDVTMEEALQAKRVIEFMKDKKKVLAFLASKGYSGASVSNEVKRKVLVSELLD